jgi:hypothetical protein
MLRTDDLRPVRGTLLFRDGLVEVEESAPDAGLPPRDALPPPAVPTPHPRPATGPREELAVIAELHRIGADLGEPVEVIREGAGIVVKGTGLSPRRQQEIRDAVVLIAGVAVRFEEPAFQALDTAPGKRVSSVAREQLESRLNDAGMGDEAVDRILDAGEAVMARAYALRALSRRFPPDVEAQLDDSGRSVLAKLVAGHVSALGERSGELARVLQPVLPDSPPAAARAARDWHAGTASLFNAAQRVDQLLNRLFAGGDFSARLPELSVAMKQLKAELEAFPAGPNG